MPDCCATIVAELSEPTGFAGLFFFASVRRTIDGAQGSAPYSSPGVPA